MVCSGCNKPIKQVLLRCPFPITMTCKQLKESLIFLKGKMLNEVCKAPYSKYISFNWKENLLNLSFFLPSVAFLHFSSAESACIFYNNYVDKGIIINGVPFSVHPAKLRNGEYVIYDHKSLNFGKCVINSAAVPQFTDTTATTVPVWSVLSIQK